MKIDSSSLLALRPQAHSVSTPRSTLHIDPTKSEAHKIKKGLEKGCYTDPEMSAMPPWSGPTVP